MREDCSCMNIRRMRGLVASVLPIKFRRRMVCTRRKVICAVSIQMATNSIKEGSWFMSNSECIIEELTMRCYNRDGQAKSHMKKFVLAVLKGLKTEVDTVKAIGSMEVGVTCEEPNVLELDEYAEELQNVF